MRVKGGRLRRSKYAPEIHEVENRLGREQLVLVDVLPENMRKAAQGQHHQHDDDDDPGRDRRVRHRKAPAPAGVLPFTPTDECRMRRTSIPQRRPRVCVCAYALAENGEMFDSRPDPAHEPGAPPQ